MLTSFYAPRQGRSIPLLVWGRREREPTLGNWEIWGRLGTVLAEEPLLAPIAFGEHDLLSPHLPPSCPNAADCCLVWERELSFDDSLIEVVRVLDLDPSNRPSALPRSLDINRQPQVNESCQVVWEGRGRMPGDTSEIFAWDGAQLIQVTENTRDDVNAHLSGQNVVWQAHDGNDWEIWIAENVFSPDRIVTRVTDDGRDDFLPQVSSAGPGGSPLIVWQKGSAEQARIFLAPEPSAGSLGLAALVTLAGLGARQAARGVRLPRPSRRDSPRP